MLHRGYLFTGQLPVHFLRMDKSLGIFIGCCVLVTTLYLAYKESAVPLGIHYRIFGKIEKPPRKFADTIRIDVKEKCAKICDRTLSTCYDPESTIFIYKDADVKDMNFEQTFSNFRSTGNGSGQGLSDWANTRGRRQWCPINDIHYSFDTLTMHQSCAIVGNGGILLDSHCGAEIDSHDLVLRANMPGIKGYSSDVGNRTTVMMINMQMTRNLYADLIQNSNKSSRNYQEALAKFGFLNDSVVWYAKGLSKGSSYSSKLRAIAKLLRREDFHTKFGFSYTSSSILTRRDYETKKTPSSGLIMLSAAQTFCKKITLYGFYPYYKSPAGKPLPYHYYGKKKYNFSTPVHDFDQEHKKLKELHKRGEIRLVIDPCEH